MKGVKIDKNIYGEGKTKILEDNQLSNSSSTATSTLSTYSLTSNSAPSTLSSICNS